MKFCKVMYFSNVFPCHYHEFGEGVFYQAFQSQENFKENYAFILKGHVFLYDSLVNALCYVCFT